MTDAGDGFWAEGAPTLLIGEVPFSLPAPGSAVVVAEATGQSLPLVAAGALALLALVLARVVLPGRSRLMRGMVAAGLLALSGAVAALAIYVANGVRVIAALGADPLGGVLWFLITGAQLALPGLAVAALALILGGSRRERMT